MQQLLVQLGDIKLFLINKSDICPSTTLKLLSFFDDFKKLNHLKIELAAVIACGEPFVKATYKLEGDGSLEFICYEAIQEVVTSIKVGNIPNVQAVARDISSSLTVQKILIAHAKQCIQPGIDYFNHQLGTSLKSLLMAFKASWMTNPS